MSALAALDNDAKKIVAKYDKPNAAVLTLLHLAQEKLGCITEDAEAWVARWTEVPAVHVREVVTFYSMYRRKPAGKHLIRFCSGTACVLAGGEKVFEHLKKKLGPDVTLEESECLCACEMAPMMQVDDAYVGPLTEKKVDEIAERLK